MCFCPGHWTVDVHNSWEFDKELKAFPYLDKKQVTERYREKRGQMVETMESPSGGEIKAGGAGTPKGREKVRVIMNLKNWGEETGWAIETEVDINKAWMKKGKWI